MQHSNTTAPLTITRACMRVSDSDWDIRWCGIIGFYWRKVTTGDMDRNTERLDSSVVIPQGGAGGDNPSRSAGSEEWVCPWH